MVVFKRPLAQVMTKKVKNYKIKKSLIVTKRNLEMRFQEAGKGLVLSPFQIYF